MKPTATQKATEDWYRAYAHRRGEDRNDILRNPGVLFQVLALQKSVVQALRTLPIQRSWSVLDVGCGGGSSLIQFLSYGFPASALHGIDIVPERIEEARKRLPGVVLTCGDASKLDYAAGSFDLVLESTMFVQLTDEHLARDIAAEMIRVTRPGHYIMLIDWRYRGRFVEYRALSDRRVRRLFNVGKDTRLHSRKRGALVPPLGRFISHRVPQLYFVVQSFLPFAVGQVTTVLQKL